MNIFERFERYESYHKEHITEFRRLLKNVAEEILITSENIPEEKFFEALKTSSNRRFCYLSKDSSNPNYLAVTLEGVGCITNQPYDDTAARELDKFMATYYPGIVCTRLYILDLYYKEVEFCFEYNIELSDVKCSIWLFNDGIEILLQHKFNNDDWRVMNEHHGSVYIPISIDAIYR